MRIPLSASAVAVAAALPAAGPVLAESEKVFESVVVTATRQEQRANEVMASVEVIDRETIERSGHSTLPELLAAQTGLRVTTNGGAGSNAAVFIRGGESRHTLVLVDGMRIGSATTGQPAVEVIPLALIERIEILRGPASALYGSEAIGGVIQIFTRKGETGFRPELFAGYGTYNTRSVNGALSGGRDRLRYSLVLGEDSTDGFNAKPDPAAFGANPDKDGFRNAYVNASGSLGFRERDEIGGSFYHSDGRNWYDTNPTFDSYLDKRLSSANVHMTNRLAEAWTSTIRVGRSEDKSRNRATADAPFRFETAQTQLVWQHDVTLPVGSLMGAYEYLDQEVGGTTDYAKDGRHVHAVLLGWTGRLGRHHLQLNARHDDNSQFGEKTTGYAGYGYSISPAWLVHGSVSTAFNAPSFNQLYFPGFGNPDLKPERAFNREVGIRWEGAGHQAGIVYFNNRVRDLIATVRVAAGLFEPHNVNEAHIEGVEVSYGGTLLGYRVRAGFDLLEAKDEATGNRLPRRADQAGFASVARTFGAWDVGVEWNGEGRRFDDAGNAIRMGGYGLLNAYAHYAVARDWRIEARANNILDKQYELVRGFATPGANVFVGVRYAPR